MNNDSTLHRVFYQRLILKFGVCEKAFVHRFVTTSLELPDKSVT